MCVALDYYTCGNLLCSNRKQIHYPSLTVCFLEDKLYSSLLKIYSIIYRKSSMKSFGTELSD